MEELDNKLRSMHKKYKVLGILAITFFLATIVVFVMFGAVGFVCLAGTAVSILLLSKVQKQYKQFYSENVIKVCIDDCSFIDGLRYEPDKGIPESTVAATGMIKTGDVISTGDLITGSYNGIAFAESSLTIEEDTGVGEDRTRSKLFGGMWLSFDLGGSFGCNMQAVSRKFRADLQRGGYSKLDKAKMPGTVIGDLCFSEEFTVYAKDEGSAVSALNGGLASALTKLRIDNNGPVMVIILDSTVHAALFTNESAFEPSIRGKADIQSEKERVMRSLRMVTGFIDSVKNINV